MNYLIIISGPGGSGKDTIIYHLVKDSDLQLKKLVSHTSRTPRHGEQHGREYFFLSPAEYEHEIGQQSFLEYEIMEANRHYYGTYKKHLLEDLTKSHVICNKMPAGALRLKQFFGEQAITIFVDADNSELERRLAENNRKTEHTQIKQRLHQAEKERSLKDHFDLIITNHDGELTETIHKIQQFIRQWIVNHRT